MPANGPSVPGGSARVSSRACRTSVSCCSSTRSESYIFRTFQSIPPPIREAISFGVRTMESGPVWVRRLVTLALLLATAVGVGAPTAVSATGGNAVDRPNQRAKVLMMGARNHHSTTSAPITTIAQPSRTTPLRQPSMMFHLVDRALGGQGALHEVHALDGDGLVEIGARENLFESLEVARPRVSRGATHGDVRPKRPRLGRKAERRERLLHAVLEQLESGLGHHARPQDVRPVIVGKDAESGDLHRQRPRRATCAFPRCLLEGSKELGLTRVVDVAQKLETEVNVFGAHPFHRQPLATLAQGRERVPQLLAHALRKVQGDKRSNRLPRR